MKRATQVNRKTTETTINCHLDMDGKGITNIQTGIGFLDHMLTLVTFHSGMSLDLKTRGDLDVDGHHTVEDIGLVLGEAFKTALGNKMGIRRYGSIYLPMDETLARVVLDISNRPYLVYNCTYERNDLGTLDVQNIKEFFKSFVTQAGVTLHIEVVYGENDHHKAEAIFKGFGQVIKQAINIVSDQLPSTKGVL